MAFSLALVLGVCGLMSAQTPNVPVPPPPPPLPFPASTGQPLPQSDRAVRFSKPARPVGSPGNIQQVRMQDVDPAANKNLDTPNPQVRLVPPGPELLFRLESEDQLQERILQEDKQQAVQRQDPDRVETFPLVEKFPPKPVLSQVNFEGRTFKRLVCEVEPTYVMHRRLMFQHVNTERYGWEMGFVQPFLSAAVFYKDVMFFPYHYATNPHVRYDASAGWCLPGDPVPYMLYPPELSITGGLLQAGVVTGIASIFP